MKVVATHENIRFLASLSLSVFCLAFLSAIAWKVLSAYDLGEEIRKAGTSDRRQVLAVLVPFREQSVARHDLADQYDAAREAVKHSDFYREELQVVAYDSDDLDRETLKEFSNQQNWCLVVGPRTSQNTRELGLLEVRGPAQELTFLLVSVTSSNIHSQAKRDKASFSDERSGLFLPYGGNQEIAEAMRLKLSKIRRARRSAGAFNIYIFAQLTTDLDDYSTDLTDKICDSLDQNKIDEARTHLLTDGAAHLLPHLTVDSSISFANLPKSENSKETLNVLVLIGETAWYETKRKQLRELSGKVPFDSVLLCDALSSGGFLEDLSYLFSSQTEIWRCQVPGADQKKDPLWYWGAPVYTALTKLLVPPERVARSFRGDFLKKANEPELEDYTFEIWTR